MKFEVKKIDNLLREIKVKVTPDELNSIEQKIVRDFQKSAEIPGFRKGRVPMGMVKNKYSDSIQKEVVEQAISQFYNEALEKSGIPAVSSGKINNLEFENVQKGLSFDIEVEVEPEIELKKYKNLEIEKEKLEVTDEMAENVKQDLRESYATVTEQNEVKEGFYVTFDAQLLGEGNVPVIGRKMEDISVRVGEGKFDSDLEQQLIGVKIGEKTIIEKQSVSSETGTDTPVTERFEITVTSIEQRDLPELNEEFVKNLNEPDIESLDHLEKKIRENLQKDLEYRTDQMLRGRIIDALLKENPFDVPNSMIDHYLEHIIADIKQKSENEPVDEDYLRQTYRPQAIHNIRWYLLKREIAQAENINVLLSEVLEAIDTFNLNDSKKEQLKKDQHSINHLKDELLEKKVLDFLLKNAKINEIEPKETQLS